MAGGRKRADRDRDLQIGANIRRARKAMGLSQAQLGHAIGRTRQSVHDWEIGRHSCERDMLEAVARTCDVGIQQLMAEKVVKLERHRGIDRVASRLMKRVGSKRMRDISSLPDTPFKELLGQIDQFLEKHADELEEAESR